MPTGFSLLVPGIDESRKRNNGTKEKAPECKGFCKESAFDFIEQFYNFFTYFLISV